MLNFTVYTVLPALMYNYYNHPKEKYKCAMIYYIGILFRSLHIKHLSCSRHVGNNDVLSTSFTTQYKQVHRDFSLLIQRCQLKLGGKQQFVINEFKWNIPKGFRVKQIKKNSGSDQVLCFFYNPLCTGLSSKPLF